jgi:hypothetical protein
MHNFLEMKTEIGLEQNVALTERHFGKVKTKISPKKERKGDYVFMQSYIKRFRKNIM